MPNIFPCLIYQQDSGITHRKIDDMSMHNQHTHKETISLQTSISVMFGIYNFFHWKMENFICMQCKNQNSHFLLGRSGEGIQKCMQLWKEMEILRKEKTNKPKKFPCVKSSKHKIILYGKIISQILLSMKNLSTYLIQKTKKRYRDSLENAAEKNMPNLNTTKSIKPRVLQCLHDHKDIKSLE